MLVQYDGTDFRGWQLQPDVRTVQGTIEDTMSRICDREVSVMGSGRTDAGVHATGQVAHADVSGEELRRLAGGLSRSLPSDVAVPSIERADDRFHARFDAVSRLYGYRLERMGRPMTARYSHAVGRDLDTAAMLEAARLCLGRSCWRAMSKEGGGSSGWEVDVRSVDVVEDRYGWTLLIAANRFLRGLVRIWAGTLVDVGRGRTRPGRLRELLDDGERRGAGPSLPAKGLTLLKVRYP